MTTETTPVPEEVLSALRKHKRVLIAAHAHPDPDAMGSSLAMAWALRAIVWKLSCSTKTAWLPA